MNALKIFNTLNSKKEIFIPIDKNHIKIYACGPTVYNFAHIGNARMAVVFDTFVRTLRVIYPKVTYVSNITDIDDKIIEAAKEQNAEITEITEKYTEIYNEDMSKLNVLKPDIQPKATEYIPEMIELIKDLISKEFAYEKDGHVLFHVPSYSMYGECSAMSEKTLGLPFDIHGGGRDLIFPHHENEIAQSCCSSANIDEPGSYAKYWMHNGFVTIDGEKMSKSLGNIILVNDLIQDHHGEVIRLALLSTHYRKGLDWNEKIIHQAKKLLNKIYIILDDLKNINITSSDNEAIATLLDDLNTPGLIAELNKIAKEYSSDAKDKEQIKSKLMLIGSVLGIFQDKSFNQVSDEMQQKIEELIIKRENAKKDKNFDMADQIRNELNELGIEIKDTSEGTSWNVKS